MLFDNPSSLNMRLRVQPRSVTVDKMAGIFTKRVWQSYFWCQIFDLLLFVAYFASLNKGIKFGDYFFVVCCVN